jgi:hypothetical protein
MRRALALCAALLALALPTRADEDGMLGLGAAWATRYDRWAVAGEILVPVADGLHLNLNVHYSRSDALKRWITSADVQWSARITPLSTRLVGFLGAGFGVITEDPRGPAKPTTRDGQIGVLAGLSYEAMAAPFVQVKLAAKKPTFLLGFRVRILS